MDSYVMYLAMRLYADISMMNAGNDQSKYLGQSMAYTDDIYEYVINKYNKEVNEINNQNKMFK